MVRVRVNSLRIASRDLAREVHLVLVLLKVDVVSILVLEVLVFLVVCWATNWWCVCKRKHQDLVEVHPCLRIPWGMLVDLTKSLQ